MFHTDIELVRKEKGYALYKKGDKYTVVRVDNEANGIRFNWGNVYSAMPNDGPNGMDNVARLSPEGIEYVANWYSKGYAYKKFKEFVEEKKQMGWV